MNSEERTREVTRQVAEQILGSAHHDEMESRRVDGDAALERAASAVVKRRVAAYLIDGVTAEQVARVGELGMAVGPLALVPPDGATYEQLQAHQELLRTIRETAHEVIIRTYQPVQEKRSTLDTVALDEEDLQPDPLTASPAESTGAHRAVVGEQDVQGREHVGHRVTVFRTDGVRSRGVLEAVTPTELLLAEPCEKGESRIPHDAVVGVVRLEERAGAAPYVNRLERPGLERPGPEEPRAAYPLEPATGPMPGRESLDSGPNRIVPPLEQPAPERVPAAQVTAQDPIPYPIPDVPLPDDLAATAPSLWQRLRDKFVGPTLAGGDRG